ncbi:DUF1553 domain-containing protein [Gimesia panareensis]|uniref:DUF1553 domain-containing protein n=1 Tax=Gimesia panareensis TaxID=2527978 RepID=UPI00118C9807|nr:DUF1553 domain-containing protein [Gimesia panareensis]QDU49202.1 Planctomycete cytochrome C [Gimesia panareensis]
MRRLLLLAFGFFCLVSAVEKRTLIAAEADLKQAEFFEKRIRPLLIAECYDCHSEDSVESGLRVDSLSGLIRGGERGPALVPGKPKESLLISAVQHSGQLHMPLKDKLSQKAIADLVQWVEAGAYWPNAKPISEIRQEAEGASGPLFTKAEQEFWAFQPPREPAVPETRNREWAQQPLDQFVLSRLEQADAKPAARADKQTLIRRATFDLIGLPPTRKEVEAFLADDSPDAFAKVIDRLLASPRYGERWGRHWLDVARYADSNGLDENLSYANAFRYRDYVIAAFNQDKPFDQFVTEQLAGDILANQPGAEHRAEKITATGFLSIGAKMLAEDDEVKMQMDIIDEQLDTVGRTFMGLTLGCARCHSHKFDPIPIEDYYSLAGIFKSTKTMENFNVVARWQEQMLASPEEIKVLKQKQQQIAKLDAEIKQIVKQSDELFLSEARKRSRDYLLASAIENYHDQLLKTTGPIGADPDAWESHSAIIVEAENFQTGNVKKATTGYGEGIGVIYNKGTLPNIAEYEIDVPKAGRYQLEIRYAAAQYRPVELSINGHLVKGNAAGEVTGSWYPKSQQWKVEGFFLLKQGKNRVRLESKVPFPHIDKLLIAEPRTATKQPGGVLAEIPAPENLVSSLTTQWALIIKKSAEIQGSPFILWNHLVEQGSVPEKLSPALERFSGLNELPEKERILKAADLYGDLFEEVLAEWEAYKQTEAGKEARRLPDSQRNTILRMLTDPESLFSLPSDRETYYAEPAQQKLVSLREQKKIQETDLPTYPTAMSVSEQKPENLRVHLRGSHFTLGKEVPRQFLRIIEGEEQTPIDNEHSGRLKLAQWLTSGSHPLTARVMVNRIWRWHFGEGLVRTPDNFGKLGERPTHPELLDWLAVQFVKQGWSIKEMHRLIMLSSTYQMSSEYNPELAGRDPENRLLWRMNRKRLEAEAIRDSILKVCGNLDLEMGGSMLGVENRKYVTSTRNVNPVIYQTSRRSVYLPIVRSALYEVLQAFDFADPSVLSGNRVHTTVAPQALFMMNSDFMMQQTSDFAEQVLHETHLDRAGKVKLIYERVYSRPASELEVSRALAYLEQYRQDLEPLKMTPEEKEQRTWQSLCRVLIASNEFLFVD